MKQISILFVALCCFMAGAKAATVSGTVTTTGTGNPQVGVTVMLTDSASSPLYFTSTVTNSSGAYSFTLPGSVGVGAKLTVMMTDSCLKTLSATHTYSGANIVQNFSGCPAQTWYNLTVNLNLPGATTNTVRSYKSYVINKRYDPLLMDTTLTAIDSVTGTGLTPVTFSHLLMSPPPGQLLLKVALTPLDSEYANYLPTYYDSALQWSSARVLTASNFGTGNVTRVYMKRATNPGGPGFIGGSVLLGANKTSGVGDPLSSRILILTNATTNKPVAYTYSNASGKFSFPSLAYGTYKIFGDVAGKTNPVLTLTLSAAKPGYSNILFEENNKTFKGQIGGLGVGGGTALAGVSAYPNPATDAVQLSGLDAISGDKSIVLTDISGAVIARERFAQGSAVRIPTAKLPAGVYLLQLSTDEGTATFRILK